MWGRADINSDNAREGHCCTKAFFIPPILSLQHFNPMCCGSSDNIWEYNDESDYCQPIES